MCLALAAGATSTNVRVDARYPARWARTRYVPTGTAENTNRPDWSVTPNKASGPIADTATPGIGTPPSSVTTPSMRPDTRSTPGTIDASPCARACTSGCPVAVAATDRPSASAVSVTDRVMSTPDDVPRHTGGSAMDPPAAG